MGILRNIYLLILCILLTGCYEDFTPETDTDPVLCINSLITAGEPINVSVTHTWLFTDENAAKDHQVDDATVRIYANGNMVDRNYLPEEGDRIRIEAESPTYGVAEAEVTVPIATPIHAVKWDAEMTYRKYWVFPGLTVYTSYMCTINLRAQMTIHDPESTDNFYQFEYSWFPETEASDPDVTISQPVSFYPGKFHDELEPIFSEHIGVLDAISGNGSYGFTFFTDRQFSGKNYTLNLRFNDMDFDMRSYDYSDDQLDCGLVLTLCTVSQSYYNWCCYQWNQRHGTLGDLSDIGLGDPMWGYSNVSTGAGVVAAQSRRSYRLSLKDFLKEHMDDDNSQ